MIIECWSYGADRYLGTDDIFGSESLDHRFGRDRRRRLAGQRSGRADSGGRGHDLYWLWSAVVGGRGVGLES